MPWALVIGIAAAGCGGAAATEPRPAPEAAEPSQPQAAFADEPEHPTYGKAELTRALAAERELVAQQDKQVAALAARVDAAPSEAAPALNDQLRIARGDLAVRRRFVATLEACDAASRLCPPRLDEPAWSYVPDPERPTPPPLTAPLRFDMASWRTLTTELAGRACACRTAGCVDSVMAAIDQLEPRPMREVQADEAATVAITAARECLYRLRGEVGIAVAKPE